MACVFEGALQCYTPAELHKVKRIVRYFLKFAPSLVFINPVLWFIGWRVMSHFGTPRPGNQGDLHATPEIFGFAHHELAALAVSHSARPTALGRAPPRRLGCNSTWLISMQHDVWVRTPTYDFMRA